MGRITWENGQLVEGLDKEDGLKRKWLIKKWLIYVNNPDIWISIWVFTGWLK